MAPRTGAPHGSAARELRLSPGARKDMRPTGSLAAFSSVPLQLVCPLMETNQNVIDENVASVLGHGEYSQGKQASPVCQLPEKPGRTLAVNSYMQIHRRPGFLHASSRPRTCEFDFFQFSACARSQKALTEHQGLPRGSGSYLPVVT